MLAPGSGPPCDGRKAGRGRAEDSSRAGRPIQVLPTKLAITLDGSDGYSLTYDDMEGRAPGSAGLQRAETYVIDRLQKTGLAPAGVHGYLQPVKLLRRRVVERD